MTEDELGRAIKEKIELDSKILRLSAALDAVPGIPLQKEHLMRQQLAYMSAYSATLRDRINLAGEEASHAGEK